MSEIALPPVSSSPIVLSLPIADRRTSFAFYRDGLGFRAVGEVADDGVPEPLQLEINDGLRLMLVPRGGFGWVIGDHEVAMKGVSECIVGIAAGSEAEVVGWIERAREAGATVVTEPKEEPWGFAGAFADPDGHLWMVTVVGAPG